MKPLLLKNATLVNEGASRIQDVLIRNERIEKIADGMTPPQNAEVFEAEGLHLLPGVIDDQVHFREPGFPQKASIASESRAAIAGGTTSFMEMPNTRPPALTRQLLEEKYAIASRHSPANYSFYMGVSNDNLDEVLKMNAFKREVCGLKIFMGSSTGNMLVDDPNTLEIIFRDSELLIATHCEDERIIQANKQRWPEANHASFHPLIRDEEACFQCSSSAVDLARRYNSRLHVLHISTARELILFDNQKPLAEKRITSEVCVHHLHFTADDYARFGNLIQCNPAIKARENRDALWEGLLDDRLDIVATDHAPHTFSEKNQPYPSAPSGIPLVQHSLLLMLSYVKQGKISLEKVVEKMSHAPATCFAIRERGFIREGYYADLVLVDLNKPFRARRENTLYHCGWSPFEGYEFPASVCYTIVNGAVVYENGAFRNGVLGKRLLFDR